MANCSNVGDTIVDFMEYSTRAVLELQLLFTHAWHAFCMCLDRELKMSLCDHLVLPNLPSLKQTSAKSASFMKLSDESSNLGTRQAWGTSSKLAYETYRLWHKVVY